MKLSEKETLAVQKLKNILKERIGDDLVELKLFGSKARGDARADSDIDVLVIVKSEDWNVSDLVYEIVTDILLEESVSISPKVISEKKFKAQTEEGIPFIKNVVREGVTV
jgi:predicted nucleotidyltransferase